MIFVGVSETVTSLAWLPKDRKSFVAAVGNKHLRIFDMRGTEYFCTFFTPRALRS